MRNRKIPNIRLNEPLKAVDVNRALDNIINTINPFVDEATIAINEGGSPVQDVVGGTDISVTSDAAGVYTVNFTGSPSGVNINAGTGINVVESPAGTFTITNTLPEDTDVVAGTGISVVESPAGTFTITNTSPSTSINVSAGTGISVVESPAGTFTVTNTGALLSGTAQTFTNDNTFAGAVTTFAGAIVQTNAGTTFTNNGTIANAGSIQGGTINATTYQNLPVDDIQAGSGIAVTESPAGTFNIINTNQGGGGGGGQILYLNGNIAGDAPLPVAGTKEFGQVVQPTGTNSSAITLPNTGAYVTINGFVTDLNIPDVLTIPAGIWDFNVFMNTNSSQPDEVAARIRLYVWNGTTSTLIGTSNQVLITNSTSVSQYTLSVIVAEQTVTATDRIYALLDAHVLGSNSHTITAYYGNTYPSHAHSTIPFAYVENILAGTAISVVESPTGTYTITNTAPDQVVALANGTGISVTGTYPNFTITNSDPASSIDVTAGTAISVVESPTGTFAVTNTAPDQVVALTGGTGISITGTYPTFTITNSDPASGVNITGGTGVAVTEPTPNNFSVAIGQAVGTTNSVTFQNVAATTTLDTPRVTNSAAGALTIKPADATSATKIVIVSGADSATIGGSQANLVGGTSTAPTAQAGGIARVDGGVASSGGTNGTVVIGNVNASAVNIGRVGITSTIAGTANINTIIPSTGLNVTPGSATTAINTTINAGASSVNAGGTLTLSAGAGQTTGGAVSVSGGASTTTTGGAATLNGGSSAATAGGTATINGGTGTTAGGAATIQGGTTTGGTAGSSQIFGGDTTAASTTAGNAVTRGGNAIGATSTGGSVFIDAGTGTSTNGRIAIGQGFSGGNPTSIRIGNNTNTNTEINGTAYTANQYIFAEVSTANINIANLTTFTTIVYNSASTSGLSLNLGTGIFTVPATGLYRVQFTGIMRAVTVPATTWWIQFQLLNNTLGSLVANTSCFQPRASGANSTAWAAVDSYEFNMDQIVTLSSGTDYLIRANNNTAAGTFVAAFEPTLTNANTSRAGRRIRLQVTRIT